MELQSLEASLEVGIAADSVMPRASYSNLPLLLVEPNDEIAVPGDVKRLGGPAERYFCALETLAARDAYEAQVALLAFKSEAKKVSLMPVSVLRGTNLPPAVQKRNFWRTTIERSGVSPIYLIPGKWWKLDLFGMLALQLILWLWHSCTHPDHDKGLPLGRKQLSAFDEVSSDTWCIYGRDLLHRALPKCCDEARVQALIPRSCQSTSVTRNTYLSRKLRERFRSFAPPHNARIHR